MASNSFSFPPPPPPPPPSSSSASSQPYPSRNPLPEWRGRGRGRGSGFGRGMQGNRNFSRDGFRNMPSKHIDSRSQPHHTPHNSNGAGNVPGGIGRGQKRRHDQAFATRRTDKEGVNTPPQVPNFGFNVDTLLQAPTSVTNISGTQANKKNDKPTKNLLGLTPSMNSNEEEGYEDEESALAQTHTSGQASLVVSYGGQTTSLNSPEEIAAWIAERRKKFPTKAKREAAAAKAKADAEERSRLKGARRDERGKKSKGHNKKEPAKNGRRDERPDEAHKAKLETERLQRELQKAQQRVAELEKAQKKIEAAETRNSQVAGEADLNANTQGPVQKQVDQDSGSSIEKGNEAGTEDIDELMQSSSDVEAVDQDQTSSSGSNSESGESSDDDEDAPPPEFSSRKGRPDQTMPPPRERPVCRDFARAGRCPRGRRCHFKHAVPEGQAKPSHKQVSQRPGLVQGKSLYQRLQEQQQDVTCELVLQHILYLGDKGYLDETTNPA